MPHVYESDTSPGSYLLVRDDFVVNGSWRLEVDRSVRPYKGKAPRTGVTFTLVGQIALKPFEDYNSALFRYENGEGSAPRYPEICPCCQQVVYREAPTAR